MAIPGTYNEKRCLEAAAAGDEKAFTEIFHRYRNKVYSIAYRITASEALSEEILLDVFLKVWLKREQLAELEHFTAWLFTITRNRVFSMLKHMAAQKRADARRRLTEEEYLPEYENPNSRLIEKEYQQVLREALERLSPQQKIVYTLIKERGLKRKEAAMELNLSPETVKRHLSEAMQVIRSYCLSNLGVLGALLLIKELL